MQTPYSHYTTLEVIRLVEYRLITDPDPLIEELVQRLSGTHTRSHAANPNQRQLF